MANPPPAVHAGGVAIERVPKQIELPPASAITALPEPLIVGWELVGLLAPAPDEMSALFAKRLLPSSEIADCDAFPVTSTPCSRSKVDAPDAKTAAQQPLPGSVIVVVGAGLPGV